MRRVLWWLIGGSRGGKNRLRIIRTLYETPMNANQLSNELGVDYKTTRHHLELLCENEVLTTMGEGYGQTYFLTDQMRDNIDVLREVSQKAEFDEQVASLDATIGADGIDHGDKPSGNEGVADDDG